MTTERKVTKLHVTGNIIILKNKNTQVEFKTFSKFNRHKMTKQVVFYIYCQKNYNFSILVKRLKKIFFAMKKIKYEKN